MTLGQDLRANLTAHYLGLLPDGLRPRAGGKAYGIVQMLTGMSASEIEIAARMLIQWLPQSADEVALAVIGEARGLNRFPGETLDIWRGRVIGAYHFWELAGTLPGVELALTQFGYTPRVREHFRDDRAIWAEFSITLTPLSPSIGTWNWGQSGARWGDGRVWGATVPRAEIITIQSIIREAKPAHAKLRRTYLQIAPPPKWGTFKWGDGSNWGGSLIGL